MQQKDSAEMPGQDMDMRDAPPARDDRPGTLAAFAPPLTFLLAVGLSAIALLYFGARDLVLPMLFLSLPLATLWLIVNDRQRRD